MNKLTIPPSPNWYESNIMSCASDNTIVYGSVNNVVIIYPSSENAPSDVRVLYHCHNEKVTNVDTNPIWNNEEKMALSVGLDRMICLIDVNKVEIKKTNIAHRTRTDKVVGAIFAGYDKIVSVSENGFIVIWKWVTNEVKSLSNLFGSSVKISCLSSCPHASYILAFGLKKGGIAITDLRKMGQILFKIRAHASPILSLTWCPVPFNVFPRKVVLTSRNVKKNSKGNMSDINLISNTSIADKNKEEITDIKQIVDDTVMDYASSCSGTQISSENPGSNIDMNNSVNIEKNSCTHVIAENQSSDIYWNNSANIEKDSSTHVVAKNESSDIHLNNSANIEKDSSTHVVAKNESSDIHLNNSVNIEKDSSTHVVVENQNSDIHLNNSANIEKDSSTHVVAENQSSDIHLNNSANIEKDSSTHVVVENQNSDIHLNNSANIEKDSSTHVVAENQSSDIHLNNSANIEKDSSTHVVADNQSSDIHLNNSAKIEKDSSTHVVAENQSSDIHLNNSAKIEKDSSTHVVAENQSSDIHLNNSSNIEKDFSAHVVAENQSSDIHLNNEKDIHKDVDKTESATQNDALNQSTDVEFTTISNAENNLVIDRKEYLLASYAKGEMSISIWRALTDGMKETELHLSDRSRNKNIRRNNNDQAWITLCWIAPHILLSSSTKAELLSWDFSNANSYGKYKPRIVHNNHNKCLFCIAAPVKIYKAVEEKLIYDELHAWTIGRDRIILNTNISVDRKILSLYQTMVGGVYCLTPSPTYPNKIAFGAGDGHLFIWDLSLPHTKYILMNSFSDRIYHQIQCVSWHPTKDTLLAFGTFDGRIGLLNPYTSKKIEYLVQFGSTAIHKLEWAPVNGNTDSYLLYAVASKRLIRYNTEKPLDAPLVYDELGDISHIAWKSDYSVCALSSKRGHVSLRNSELKLLFAFYIQNKAVHHITWHPQATVEDESISPYANWVAVAAHEVIVYDCIIYDSKESQELSERIMAQFKVENTIVNCLSWSPFVGGKLAGTTVDGTAMIWDVKEKVLLHVCVSSIEDNWQSVLWSPLLADYIIVGTKTSMLHILNILDDSSTNAKESKAKRPKPLKLPIEEQKQSDKDLLYQNDNKKQEQHVSEVEKPKKGIRKYVLGGLVNCHQNEKYPLLRDCKRLFNRVYGKEFAPVNEESEQVTDPSPDAYPDLLKIFGNEEDFEKVLKLQGQYCAKKQTVNATSHLALWTGNIGNNIIDAIRTKTVNEFHISMAPTVSHELYLEACEAYAQQLYEDVSVNDTYKIVSYYLACHKIRKAIEVLCTTNNYLEAYCLARSRLMADDALIYEILERWAKFNEVCGNFEIAAQCYIILRRLEDAVITLSRRNDQKTLTFCLELARYANNKDLCNALSFRLSSFDSNKSDEDDSIKLNPLLTRAELEILTNRLSITSLNQQCNQDVINESNINAVHGDIVPDDC